MTAKAKILIIICLLFLIGTVGAILPTDVAMNRSPDWVIANGVDQSTFIVTVTNMSIGYPNANVTFNVNNTLGTLSPTFVTTDLSGKAISTFTTNTVSGAALITAIVTYTDAVGTYTIPIALTQNIDHDIPYLPPSYEHPREGTVATEVPFTISFTDRWGNFIDNRNTNEVHTVQLTVYGPDPNDCGFVEAGYGQVLTQNLTSEGNLSVHLKLTQKPGLNNILIRPLWSTISLARTIEAVANGVPFSITQIYDPPGTPPSLPADGNKKFTIKYALFDQWGNPTRDQNVSVNIGTVIEDKTTNSDGEVWIEYGPSLMVHDTIIIATAVNNPSVTISNTARFYDQYANDFTVDANPKIMASFDANSNARAYITAKVIDGNGFPVKNESVSFVINTGSISPPGYCSVCNVTALPYLVSPTSVKTDNYGNALVVLIPGAFNKDKTSPNYTAAATGSCFVSATWKGPITNITKNTPTIVWKNYPYLTVTTNVSPQVVNVSETVDVRIKLNGDGFGYSKKPIDVALVIDRSGSMLGTKLTNAKTAAVSFVNQMDNTTDQLAVVSYSGYTCKLCASGYTEDSGRCQWTSGTGHDHQYYYPNEKPGSCLETTGTIIDIPLTSVFGNVANAINGLDAGGATESREALKQSIEIVEAGRNPNPKSLQAVIFMTDGNYNWLGNPLGRGTGYPAPYDSFSTSPIESNKYRYYDGLGGTLHSSGVCYQTSTTMCDTCDPDYTPGSGVYVGRCQWTSGWGHNHLYYTPATKPSSCDTPHCNIPEMTCTDGYTTNQNMANYANSKNIRLYMISFGNLNDLAPQAVADMNYMSTTTTGFYRHASTGTELIGVYNEIAGDLKSEAAVNTTMSLDFGTITVNNMQQDGFDVFDYVNDSSTSLTTPGSTWINKFNKTSTNFPTFPYTVDDTANWATNKSLTFNVGTIKLNETWEANFRLKVLREGNIQIFGPTSVIIFTDSMNVTNTLTLPNTSISAREVATNVTEKKIKLENLIPVGTITNKTNPIPMEWTTKYDGTSTVTERVFYSYDNGPWYQFNLKTGILNGTSHQTASLDVSGFPTGYYYIRVVATSTSNDAAMVYATYGPIRIAGKGIFIKLE